MSRCVICDQSSDIEGVQLRMSFNEKEGGYVCEECSYLISSSVEEMEENDREIAVASEENSPHLNRSGKEQQLSLGFGSLRQEEEDSSVSLQLVQNPPYS